MIYKKCASLEKQTIKVGAIVQTNISSDDKKISVI